LGGGCVLGEELVLAVSTIPITELCHALYPHLVIGISDIIVQFVADVTVFLVHGQGNTLVLRLVFQVLFPNVGESSRMLVLSSLRYAVMNPTMEGV
jgi:hypothetical protein